MSATVPSTTVAVATNTGPAAALPTVNAAELPCSAPSSAERPPTYSFFLRNQANIDIDVYYRNGCDFTLGVPGVRNNARINVLMVYEQQVYVVRPAGDNTTNLAALVFSPELNLSQEKPWSISTDTIGKVITASKIAPTTSAAVTTATDGGNNSSPSSVPYIIAAVVGALGILAAIGVVAFIMYRRRQKNQSSASNYSYSYNKKGELSVGSPTAMEANPAGTLGSASLRNGTINYSSPNGAGTGTYGRDNKQQRTSLMWWQTPANDTASRNNSQQGTLTKYPEPPATPVDTFNAEPGSRLRVIHPHRKDLEDELTLHPGDAVVLIESYGDGWCLARCVRSRRQHEGASAVGEEGMIPTGCLDSVPDRSLGRGGNNTIGRSNNNGVGNNATSPSLSRYEDDSYWTSATSKPGQQEGQAKAPKSSKRVKSLQRPESMALFQAAGRDISQYYPK
ncbi:hypothetical protein HDU67_006228 [Dinochytrium kinnereticum]|nr:hypothetical protein HDU67_006228 [Dinochytrium kinnereticum]